jgi:tetratricopeptide (TPR) repeat protein
MVLLSFILEVLRMDCRVLAFLVLSFFGTATGSASEVSPFKIIVDLSPNGSDPKKAPATLIRECTEILNGREKGDANVVVNARWARGWAYLMMHRPEKAKDDFEIICKLRPDNATFYALRAVAMADLGKMEDANALANQALKKDPLVPALYAVSGSIDAAQGNWSGAASSVSSALMLDEEFPSALYLKAWVAFATGDYTLCVSCANKYVTLDPPPRIREPDHPFIIQGSAYVALARYRDAVSSFSTARKLSPSSAWAVAGISTSYFEMRQWQLAAKAADEAAALAPDDAWKHMTCALFKARVGEKKMAQASLQRARDLINSMERNAYARPSYDGYAAMTYFYLGEYQKVSGIINATVDAGANSATTNWVECEMLASCPDAKYRDGPRALKIATAMLDYERKLKRPEQHQLRNYLLLANAQAECGDFASALASARKALELAGDCDVSELRQRIRLFENKKPYRHTVPSD